MEIDDRDPRAPTDPDVQKNRSKHRHPGWLERSDEHTVIEKYAERFNHEGEPRPGAWSQPVIAPSGPLHPPGYDVAMSTLRMTLLLLLFSWVPLFNGAFAGLIGGWRAGTQRRALTAAVLSVALVCGAFLITFVATDRTLVFFYGLPFVAWSLITLVSTLLGAWAGAASQWAVRETHGPVRRWTEGPWAEPRRRDWIEG